MNFDARVRALLKKKSKNKFKKIKKVKSKNPKKL